MKLIVGLGNPGLSYTNTRHNLGVRLVKAIAREHKLKLRLSRSLKSRVAKAVILDQECLLSVPNTFMNLSGEAVNLLVNSEKISLRDLLVIHDDIDLELGLMRFRKKGSSGGHKGVESIIRTLGTNEFSRLKLGIGKGFSKNGTKDYVLSRFCSEEIKIINPLIKKLVKACEIWVKFGIEKAMNDFNQMKPKLSERSEAKFGLHLIPHHF